MQQQIPPRVAANVLQRPAQAPGVMRGQQHQQQQILPRNAANIPQQLAPAAGAMGAQGRQQQQPQRVQNRQFVQFPCMPDENDGLNQDLMDNQQQLCDQIVHVRTNFRIQAGRMITQDPFNDAMCMVIWPDYYIRSIRFNILANRNPHNRICLKTGLLGIKKLVKQICDINRDDLLTTYFASFEQTMPR